MFQQEATTYEAAPSYTPTNTAPPFTYADDIPQLYPQRPSSPSLLPPPEYALTPTASDPALNFEKTLLKANSGDAEAQIELGDLSREAKDYSQAMKWFVKAADQGNAVSHRKLGYLYDFGLGVPQNDSLAYEWYLKSAELGDPLGQCNLALCYKEGQGVEQDLKKYLECMFKAGEQGVPQAQCSIGVQYKLGECLEKDFDKAMKWLLKAADQGNEYAQDTIGDMYLNGEGVPADAVIASEWYLKAAEQGCAEAQFDIARLYDNGEGVPKDYEKAMEWYLKSAEQGFAPAQNNIGALYKKGHGVPQDYNKAVEWYRKCAEQGHRFGQMNLGVAYMDGEGVEKDYQAAMEWCLKSADQGNATAMALAGSMHHMARGVERDLAKAKAMYLQALEMEPENEAALKLMKHVEEHIADEENMAFKTKKSYVTIALIPTATSITPTLMALGHPLDDEHLQAVRRVLNTSIPLRIAAFPGPTLDVVVAGQLVRPESTIGRELSITNELYTESRQEPPPYSRQEDNRATHVTQPTSNPTAVRQNLAYGHVETAVGKHTHIENPATTTVIRGLQAVTNSKTSTIDDRDDTPELEYSTNKGQAHTPMDYTEAVRRARLGDKDAQVAVGIMYIEGSEVGRDYQAAMDWFLKAAEQEHPHAQFYISAMFNSGQGVPQDFSKAMEWCIKAGEQGHKDALYNLGYMHEKGQGVPQSYSEAMRWYLKAADQRQANAFANIGYLFEYGHGVPKSDSEAMHWYLKGADEGDAVAQFNIGLMYARGRGGSKRAKLLDADSVEQEYKAARENDLKSIGASED
ncbi:hypothetical protein BGW39_011259 [Mortierella sp. 14UC]|nr:hypothetical protein BGW39_011259 [Mortierella sp. 14UC]